ncbi:MAG: GNAT family N-acetyltransferase, partial [Acidimicrobiia bacterium]
MFAPIRTKRLLIRPFELDDLAEYHARRSDPEVALYQDWELPYPMERAEKVVSAQAAMDGP